MDDEPKFPLSLTRLDTGETETYDDAQDLLCNLEDFDSSDPRDTRVASVTDALGRPVDLVVKIWGLCQFILARR